MGFVKAGQPQPLSYLSVEEKSGWVRFRLYLRPWGTDWEDVRTGDTSGCLYRNMLPPDYDSWYAPLLARGVADMPDSFGTAK